MASGYVRQSSSEIVTGQTIESSDFNNEFNALETAFGTAGHDHSGGAGYGPKITPGGVANMTSDGIAVRTSATVFTPRTITGTANEITVTNGDGVAGNPTLSLPTALTFTGKTVTGGTITGITDLAVADGGTGASSASTARINLGIPIENLYNSSHSGSASYDFETASWFDGTYSKLKFELTNVVVSVDDNVWFRVKASGSYQADAGDYNQDALICTGASSISWSQASNTRALLAQNMDNLSTQNNIITLENFTYFNISTLLHRFRSEASFLNSDNTNLNKYFSDHRYTTAEAITGLRFGCDAGTLSFTLRVWGYRA